MRGQDVDRVGRTLLTLTSSMERACQYTNGKSERTRAMADVHRSLPTSTAVLVCSLRCTNHVVIDT